MFDFSQEKEKKNTALLSGSELQLYEFILCLFSTVFKFYMWELG